MFIHLLVLLLLKPCLRACVRQLVLKYPTLQWDWEFLSGNPSISMDFIENHPEFNWQTFETDHFKLTSKDMSLPEDKRLNFDIWLDKKTSVIVKVTYERMGNWEYRIKNYE